MNEFGEKYEIAFNVIKYRDDKNDWEDINHGKKLIGNQKPKHIINLVLLDKHYFLNENVEGINKYYLDHYDEINEACKNKSNEWKMKVYTMKNRKGKQVYEINNKQAHMKSYEFVRLMTSDHVSWSFDELCHLKSNLYEFASKDIKDLNNFSDKDFKSFNDNTEKKTKKLEHTIYFADTETDITGDIHKAFCIVYSSNDDNTFKFKFGKDCLKEFLEDLPNNALVYFHNLGYDIRQFSEFNLTSGIEKGSKYMNARIVYKGKNIYFKDSLSIISMKLTDFPSSFGLETGAKEMFPYHYYKLSNLNEPGNIKEAGKQGIHWNQKIFEENVDKISGCKIYD